MKKNLLSFKGLFLLLFCIILFTGIYNVYKPLPPGLSYDGEYHRTEDLKFLGDLTWKNGDRFKTDHEIFDEILFRIKNSEKFILLDMFLFNDFMGKAAKDGRSLSSELKNALISKKLSKPEIFICVVTDPVNKVYNGLVNPLFTELEKAGINVVFTNLDRLRDSNPIYSAFYRVFFRFLGNSPGETVKSPFRSQKISLRSYFKLLNFKANHRKVLLCDNSGYLYAVISSMNPHDASSLHSNSGVSFTGKAAIDILETEKAVLKMSGFTDIPDIEFKTESFGNERIKVVTEKKILDNILNYVKNTEKGDKISIVMFYLSHRDIISALKKASARGVKIRILLDANKDAFGREKNGIPNKVTAQKLYKSGIRIKWAKTDGQQLHTKLILIKKASGKHIFTTGSANLTRRNLDNFNLETNVIITCNKQSSFFKEAEKYINTLFSNKNDRLLSLDYKKLSEDSFIKMILYFLMEETGFCTF